MDEYQTGHGILAANGPPQETAVDAARQQRGAIHNFLMDFIAHNPFGSVGSLQSASARAVITGKIKALNMPTPFVQEEVTEFAICHLRETLIVSNEQNRMMRLDALKVFLSGFNIFIQQNQAIHSEVLKIHMLSSNAVLASAARTEFGQLRTQAKTKLEEW